MLTHFFWTDAQSTSLAHGEHDLWLVLLSLLVSCIASGQALRLAAFARLAATPQLRMWSIISGSMTLGTGIWAMHFIGMLAYSTHGSVHYHIGQTILSILPGIAASAVALMLLARHELNFKQLFFGGLIVGIGIAAMHYSGMAAMEVPEKPQYSPFWFAVSLVVGSALAMLALWVRFGIARLTPKQVTLRKTIAAIIMGAAIAGMHYSAMIALRMPAHSQEINQAAASDNRLILALTIALVALTVGGLISQANGLIHYRMRWQKVDMNEARLQALVNMAADGIICIDTRGLITDYNPAAQAIFEWTAEEVMGQNVKMLMPAALAGHHDHYLSRHEQGQENSAPPLKNKISEVLGQSKSGALVPLRLALSQAEARGQRMYVGLLTDLSERKKTERQLHIAATVFDHCYEGVVVLDSNHKIVDINPAFIKMSGLQRLSAKNKDFATLFVNEDALADLANVWTEIGRNGHWQGAWTLRVDGRKHQISLTAVRDEQQRLHHYIAICYQTVDSVQACPT